MTDNSRPAVEPMHLADNVYATYDPASNTVTLRDGINVIRITLSVNLELVRYMIMAELTHMILHPDK